MSQFGRRFEVSESKSQTLNSQSVFKKPLEYLLPVTVAMLRNAEQKETKLFINNRELIAVLLVGKVDSVVVSARKVYYTMTDCSGIIQVKWIDEKLEVQKILKGSYFKVYANPSIYNGQPRLNAFRMMQCESFDVSEHYMSVLHAEEYIKKVGTDAIEMLGKLSKPIPMSIDNDSDEQSDVTCLLNEGLLFNTTTDKWVKPTELNANGHYLPESQSQLLMLIKEEDNQTENGVNVNWLSEYLQRDVHDDLMYLMNEGLVYDTVSEEWVKLT